MKRSLLLVALFGALVLGLGPGASAQVSRSTIGPKLGVYLSGGSHLMLGGIANFAISPQVTISPGLEVVLGVPNITRLIIDGNINYNFPIRGETFSPFVMGGLSIWYDSYKFTSQFAVDSRTDLRLNLGGGVIFGTRSNIQPWGGLKIVLLAGSDVVLQGGVNFSL